MFPRILGAYFLRVRTTASRIFNRHRTSRLEAVHADPSMHTAATRFADASVYRRQPKEMKHAIRDVKKYARICGADAAGTHRGVIAGSFHSRNKDARRRLVQACSRHVLRPVRKANVLSTAVIQVKLEIYRVDKSGGFGPRSTVYKQDWEFWRVKV